MDRIVVSKSLLAQKAPAGTRACGSCSACCKAPDINQPTLTKAAGVWCPHWKKGVGCGIYATRPSACVDFQCEWFKGLGEDIHRPDRTKIVLDYVLVSNGLPGGFLQMWEVIEGALSHAYAKAVTREVLASNIWVVHRPLVGRKKLFVPSDRALTEDIIKAVDKLGHTDIVFAADLKVAQN